MATVGCPPGYSCPPPVEVGLNQLEPGSGWQFLYTPFENQGDPNTDAIGEYMDFEFHATTSAGMLSAFQQEITLDFWSAWRQTFVNAGSDMYIAKVYVLPPPAFPGTATYRVVVVHSQAVGVFLDLVGGILDLLVKSPFLIVFLGIIFFGQTILAFLSNFCANVAGDYCHPIGSAEGVFIWVTVAGGIASILGWYIINRLSQHEGTGKVAPPAPPAFGTPSISTGTGLHLGPVSQTAGISSSGGQAQPARIVQAERAERPKRGAKLGNHAEEGLGEGRHKVKPAKLAKLRGDCDTCGGSLSISEARRGSRCLVCEDRQHVAIKSTPRYNPDPDGETPVTAMRWTRYHTHAKPIRVRNW